jgi:hypothetical protein
MANSMPDAKLFVPSTKEGIPTYSLDAKWKKMFRIFNLRNISEGGFDANILKLIYTFLKGSIQFQKKEKKNRNTPPLIPTFYLHLITLSLKPRAFVFSSFPK